MTHEVCKYEKEWGRTMTRLDTLAIDVKKLREDVTSLERQNITLERLNVNFNHLLAEVRDSNTSFHKMFAKLDERLTDYETEEGEYLRKKKRDYAADIIKYLVLLGIGALLGQIGGV